MMAVQYGGNVTGKRAYFIVTALLNTIRSISSCAQESSVSTQKTPEKIRQCLYLYTEVCSCIVMLLCIMLRFEGRLELNLKECVHQNTINEIHPHTVLQKRSE